MIYRPTLSEFLKFSNACNDIRMGMFKILSKLKSTLILQSLTLTSFIHTQLFGALCRQEHLPG